MAIWEALYRLTYHIGENGIDFTTFLIAGWMIQHLPFALAEHSFNPTSAAHE
jgi:hypothetical protein